MLSGHHVLSIALYDPCADFSPPPTFPIKTGKSTGHIVGVPKHLLSGYTNLGPLNDLLCHCQ